MTGVNSSRPVDYALIYAALGHVVLPLQRASNRPHAMLGSGWTRDTVGSTDPDQIHAWWENDPAANIGIVNGPRSGVLIVDVDRKPGRPDGVQSLWSLMAEVGQTLPPTRTVETPSGGLHLWFRLPPGEDVPIPKVWLPSVEVTWQVAVPPSCRAVVLNDAEVRESVTHYVEYQWRAEPQDYAEAPAWLLADLRARPAVPYGAGSSGGATGDRLPSTDWFVEHGLGGHSGSRNIDCHRLACRLWRHHWPNDDLVTSVIYAAWQATDATGFPWREAVTCIESAKRHVVPQIQQERAWISELRSNL